MFEVGKKYGFGANLYVMKCIFADERVAFFEYIKGTSGHFHLYQHKDHWKNYPEFIEPKIEKITRFICRDAGGNLYTYQGNLRPISAIGEYEVTITDDKLTNAKILS